MQAFEQDLLKSSDVQQIMKQILNQHLGDKKMNAKVLQTAIVNFIDQFDPNRIYLLQSEVDPFLQESPQELNQLLVQYQNNDYAIFEKLNHLIQQAILRSRLIRKGIEDSSKESLFNTSTSKQEESNFANNQEELKKRLIQHFENYVHSQKKRYGIPSTQQRKDFIIHTYEEKLHELENQYLYQDEKGEPLLKPEQDNLFYIHVLKALASSLDSHTSFYQSNEAYDMRLHLKKEFQGIGITFKEMPNGVIVSNIIPDGPAAKNGQIKSDDILVQIDDKSILNYPFEKIMDLLHDEGKPEIKLTFSRPAKEKEPEKKYHVTLKREVIIVNNDRVDTKEVKLGNGIIGIITLHSFYQGGDISSEKDVRQAIEKFEKNGPLKGLILDLRDNRGGFLSQAIKVAGLFITNGVIVISKYADGEEHFYRDVDGKTSYDGPLVILTSKITASAAEIVAQALQDYGVALIVGDESTYGKGTIQTQTVTDNRSASYFKVTVGKYYTVSGKTPQKEGVKADLVVPSHWQNVEVGERYADSVEGDKIPASFDDSLIDVKPDLKPWYMKYYTPKLQHRTNIWRNLLPTLKKNSSYRIANNKNYQFYLQGHEAQTNDSDEDEWAEDDKKGANGGEDDLQLEEAVNIVKDMYQLHATANK
jgi:carboxyl-terminal processing protease